jgi:uncharacterized protein YdiU (UPF0061 family)
MSWERLRYDNSYSRLPEHFYSRVAPTPVPEPYLVHLNPEAARLIDLDHEALNEQELAEVLSGNRLLDTHEPLAMLYAGHQFGQWVPQLGDGRAIQLAEVVNADRERWALQLKGSGLTPYSRGGDGRAVLRSTIREYLCSEAMHGLGVPTTRALSMVGSDMEVYREEIESAAILLRLAPNFVRFGHFEVFASRGQTDDVKRLADYVIAHHFPELENHEHKYAEFFLRVVELTADLIAHWQAVGFMHGVMNTDNMSILGLTIDYGPFGFMEAYQPGHICNHSDYSGRYRYKHQPDIGLWNLTRLGEALGSLVDETKMVKALGYYERRFLQRYSDWWHRKLGLFDAPREGDAQLINDFLEMMEASGADFTNSFRALCEVSAEDSETVEALRDEFIDRAGFDQWLQRYRERLSQSDIDEGERQQRMRAINPRYVLRNYQAQVAIEQAQKKDYREIDRLLTLLRRPFEEQPGMEEYTRPAPDWAREMEVSCSS